MTLLGICLMEQQMADGDNSVYLALGRLEGKVDQLIGAMSHMDKRMENIEKKTADDIKEIGERVTKLENNRYFVLGIVAAISSMLSYVVSYLKG